MERKSKGVGIVLKDLEGRILLQHRDNKLGILNPDKFALFGGGVEEGESEIDAVIRETQEELGFYVEKSSLSLFGVLRGKSYSSHIYEYSIPVSLEDVHLQEEGQGMAFFSREEIASDERCLPYLRKLFPCDCLELVRLG